MNDRHNAILGAVIGWGTWLGTHLVQFNVVLQTVLLLLSIGVTAIALKKSLRGRV